ncbi:probable E3 ubiquitin-protein ligase HECTD2 isoform X1 [Hydra vulgaris]|nr:probable E3 ubiquitin-protein ligase HECTD2 [Hydra vulgaris]XP_047127441.1 probable E3 ubiquitin-protein ligase HECTD2 [Hydra vulgaris]
MESFFKPGYCTVKNPVFSLSTGISISCSDKDENKYFDQGLSAISKESTNTDNQNAFQNSKIHRNTNYKMNYSSNSITLPPIKSQENGSNMHEVSNVKRTSKLSEQNNLNTTTQASTINGSIQSNSLHQNVKHGENSQKIGSSSLVHKQKEKLLNFSSTSLFKSSTVNTNVNLKFTNEHSKGPKSDSNNNSRVLQIKPQAIQSTSENKITNENFETEEDFCKEVCESRLTNEYDSIIKFLMKIFGSLTELYKVFKNKKNNDEKSNDVNQLLDINLNYLDYMYESIVRMPESVKKAVLRSIINCMMTENSREKSTDQIKALIILLLNPLFADSKTYVIFSHVIRQICMSQVNDHHQFINFFKQLPVKELKIAIHQVTSFISYRLFPTNNEIIESEMSSWWIPNAVKVLALMNAANENNSNIKLPRSVFYIRGLELLDLLKEYQSWQMGTKGFSFCQYPFLLSLSLKRYIMQKDSESKMLLEARQSLVNKVREKKRPNMGMLFLTLNVRRKFILEDSLSEISKNHGDLRKKLRVIFQGEPAVDLGGVSKEWFFLIIQKLFNEDYGMFKYNSETKLWWFNASCKENYKEFNLCGVLIGLAMYNGINLNIGFPPCLYKKLLSPAVVPYNNPHALVGVAPMDIEEFKQVYPDLANGLKELLFYEGNVEEDLCQTFQVSFTEYGVVQTRILKPNGESIPVTNDNKKEYVSLYIDYFMNKCIYQQFYSFYHGFHSVCASNALLLLRPDEVETLVIGDADFNIRDLEKVTKYDGYRYSDTVIRNLWDVLYSYSQKQQRKFLFFCTGSDRIPIGGVKEINFKVTKVSGANATQMLPVAHTCFNQLCLPMYKGRKTLAKKLTIAIENGEGFGLE